MGESGDDFLRHFRHSTDAHLFGKYWRRDGTLISLPLLESVLLCVHEETEKATPASN